MVPLQPEELTKQEQYIMEQGNGLYLYPCRSPDGDLYCIYRMLSTAAIIQPNETGINDRWCYHHIVDAMQALGQWDGADKTEPEGWHRHPQTGRRREKGKPEEVIW